MKKHNERCRNCKKRVYEILTKLYGEVKINHNLKLSNELDSFKDSQYYLDLQKIYVSLQDYRGLQKFIRAKNLPNVDFFVVNPGFIVEFDESQHFTKPREITLKNYPSNLKLNFNKERWIELCQNLHKKDNDPPFRDEQRAWYDTLRDFAPYISNLKPTIRIYASDYKWCSFNPKNEGDINKFQNIAGLKK